MPYLSALENVELGLQLRAPLPGPSASAPRAISAAPGGGSSRSVSRSGFARRPSRLSAGERQRVAIARALAADVRLLLVDEPTARLDEENARAVAGLLARAAHERRLAVVCATHDPVLIELADDIGDARCGGLTAVPALLPRWHLKRAGIGQILAVASTRDRTEGGSVKKRILFGVPLIAVVGVALVIVGVATGKVNRAQSASALPVVVVWAPAVQR